MTSLTVETRLAAGYRESARLTRRYATTYYWGAAVLPRAQRRHVHAVYAVCRTADDIVDLPVADAAKLSPAARLEHYGDAVREAITGDIEVTDPVLAALRDTVRRCGVDPGCFDRFFAAMTMDLTISSYATYDELCGYMDGSAAVIGEMMLPILQPLDVHALDPARALGVAFQLTNFLRDVGEDLDRGRVYLPRDELAAYGVTIDERRVTPEWRAFMAFQVKRTRALYRRADEGLAMLPPRAARCIAAARLLYSRILDRIEAADYDVFTTRVRVPTAGKAATAVRMMLPMRRPLTISGGGLP